MAHDPKLRSTIRAHFIQGMPLATAAKVADVSYQTARNWKRADKDNGDDWDLARAARQASATGLEDITIQILEELSLQVKATLEQIKDAKDMMPQSKAEILTQLSDAYIKAAKAASTAAPKLSALSVAFDVLKELGVFVNQNYPSYNNAFIEILEAFGPEISRRFG